MTISLADDFLRIEDGHCPCCGSGVRWSQGWAYCDGAGPQCSWRLGEGRCFFCRSRESRMATETPAADAVSVVAIRRRASAQQRLRRVAGSLDQLPIPTDAEGYRLRDEDMSNPTLTADQLRLVADLLDHETWGQLP